MGGRECAASLQRLPTSLRKWRDRFENAEVEIDWRAHLHPSARPKISTGAGSAAEECPPEMNGCCSTNSMSARQMQVLQPWQRLPISI